MTEYLTVDGGTLAYDVSGGTGPLVVLAHGVGNDRTAYRFVAPALARAGHRVAAVDLRGCGGSSATWDGYSRTDIAGDLLALVEHLGGPAVLVGHSIAGGAVTIAAATEPSQVTAAVELAPFTRKPQMHLADLRVGPYRRGLLRLLRTGLGSTAAWLSYLHGAHPGPKPADWDAQQADIAAMLREPGRMKALQKMLRASPADAGARLGEVRCPVLVIEGALDPDWPSPRAEGEAIVGLLPPGLGRLELVAGAGHYPHVQMPEQVVALVLAFLDDVRA